MLMAKCWKCEQKFSEGSMNLMHAYVDPYGIRLLICEECLTMTIAKEDLWKYTKPDELKELFYKEAKREHVD